LIIVKKIILIPKVAKCLFYDMRVCRNALLVNQPLSHSVKYNKILKPVQMLAAQKAKKRPPLAGTAFKPN